VGVCTSCVHVFLGYFVAWGFFLSTNNFDDSDNCKKLVFSKFDKEDMFFKLNISYL
jgi:hypothetical protein